MGTVDIARRLQNDRYAAMIAGDDERLAELLAPDLVYVHSNGDVETRDQYLAGFARRQYVYHQIDVEDARTIAQANEVVLFERASVTMTITALDVTKQRSMVATSVWKRYGDEWLLALMQSTATA